jgi:hypothetical protein
MNNEQWLKRLDSLVWDEATWQAEFFALLDAIEFADAVADEYGAPEGGLKPDAEL